MTMAISKAVEAGRRPSSAPHRQHQRQRRGVRSAGRADLRGPRTDRQDRPRQAGAGAGARRAAARGRRQLRRLPDAGPRPGRTLTGDAGQQRQSGPDRGPEDRVLRDLRRARRRPGHPLPAGRQRRQHHGVLEGLQGVRAAAGHAMLGFQAAGAAPIVRRSGGGEADDDRHGDPHRQSGLLGVRARRPRRERRGHRSGQRPADPCRRTSCWPRAKASSSSRRAPRAWRDCCRRGPKAVFDAGLRVVCTVTGHGLKDPDWAITGAAKPVKILPDVDAAASQLGL